MRPWFSLRNSQSGVCLMFAEQKPRGSPTDSALLHFQQSALMLSPPTSLIQPHLPATSVRHRVADPAMARRMIPAVHARAPAAAADALALRPRTDGALIQHEGRCSPPSPVARVFVVVGLWHGSPQWSPLYPYVHVVSVRALGGMKFRQQMVKSGSTLRRIHYSQPSPETACATIRGLALASPPNFVWFTRQTAHTENDLA